MNAPILSDLILNARCCVNKLQCIGVVEVLFYTLYYDSWALNKQAGTYVLLPRIEIFCYADKPYTTDSSEVLTVLQKSTLTRFLGELDNYIIWLNVNDKIYKENKSASILNQMTRTDLEKEFGINTLSDAERTTKYNLIKNYVGIKEASEEDNSAGLMAWNGQTLTVRGDIIANNLVLGADVKIHESNIGDLTNYITTNGLENKLKDYSTTEEIKSGGLGQNIILAMKKLLPFVIKLSITL